MNNYDKQVDMWLDLSKPIEKSSEVSEHSEDLTSAENNNDDVKDTIDINIELYKSSSIRYDDSEEYWNDYYNRSKRSIDESFKVSSFQEFYTALKCADNTRSKRNMLKDTPLKVKRFNV